MKNFKSWGLSLKLAVLFLLVMWITVMVMAPVEGSVLTILSLFTWAIGRICKASVENEFK